jgi:RHS repeat-associated protein
VNNSANAHSGSYYADLTAPAGSVSTTLTTTQPISAQIGETITSTGWVYRESGNNPVYSRWWLSVVGTNGSVASHAADSSTMNAWVYQTNSVVVPSWLQGPYTVTVAAQVISNAGVVAARFDDATLNGSNLLFAEDSLGTTRVTTDPSGVVCYDADFYPFGGERTPYTNSCSPTYKFEGKERDTETGNDDFGARYYSNRFGRWLSADWSAIPVPVPYANLTNPQSLNLYAMVGDDPETFADLDGHECFDDGSCNALRNPLSADHWVLNGLSNTLSDLLSLDTVAHGAAAAGNSDLPTKDRVIGGAKVIGVAVVDTVGGEIAGKVLGKAAGAILGKSGIEAAVQLGKEGEALAGIVKNTERIESLTTGGAVKYRVPDVLDRAAGVIGEVKNVTRQGLTAQIKDDIAFAAKNNLKFELHVNRNTTFTKPLQKLINSGVVNVIRF